MCEFPPDRKMVEAGVSLRWSVVEEDADGSRTPKGHLNSLIVLLLDLLHENDIRLQS